jgi:hypothetical protein
MELNKLSSLFYTNDFISSTTLMSDDEYKDYTLKLSKLVELDTPYFYEWFIDKIKRFKTAKNRWQTSFKVDKEIGGVYCIFLIDFSTGEQKLMYIGSSKNISKRLKNKNHPYLINYDLSHSSSLLYVKFRETEDYINLEKQMIKKLNPFLNIRYAK